MKSEKKIHIRLPEDLHKKLRVKCAYEDVSLQEYVEQVIRESVAEYSVEDTLAEVGLQDRKKSAKRRSKGARL